jgi:hypothetical protein
MDVIDPNVWHRLMPVSPLKDSLMISGTDRLVVLRQRLVEHYGRIDREAMIEIMKRPVSMKSNLHNAIFAPDELTMWLAVAKNPKKVEEYQACFQTYYEYDMEMLLTYMPEAAE